MDLLSDENKIMEGSGDRAQVTLTNRRLMLESRSIFGGHSNTTSFHLEDLDSVEMAYRSYLWMLIIGGLLILSPVFFGIEPQIPIIVGIILIIAYFATRKKGAKFNSTTATIFIGAKTTAMKDLEEFVQTIEQTKLERLNQYSIPRKYTQGNR